MPADGIDEAERAIAARAAVLTLVVARAAGATVCPSEAARVLAAEAGAEDWRGMMPAVHAAVDRLADEGLVRLSWKGVSLVQRAGPYRIGRGTVMGVEGGSG